jgi:hypothetical protein
MWTEFCLLKSDRGADFGFSQLPREELTLYLHTEAMICKSSDIVCILRNQDYKGVILHYKRANTILTLKDLA